MKYCISVKHLEKMEKELLQLDWVRMKGYKKFILIVI